MKFCPNCGFALREGDRLCPNCGFNTDKVVEKKDAPAIDNNMKYCSHCGAKVLKQAVICPSCGCSVSEKQAPTEGNRSSYSDQGSSKATAGLVLGIFSLVLATISYFIFGFLSFVGLGLGIPALITSILARCSNGKKIPAIVISAIGLLLSFVAMILYIIVLTTIY